MTVHVRFDEDGSAIMGRRIEHGYGVTTSELRFGSKEWREFIKGVQAGQFDLDVLTAPAEELTEPDQ